MWGFPQLMEMLGKVISLGLAQRPHRPEDVLVDGLTESLINRVHRLPSCLLVKQK